MKVMVSELPFMTFPSFSTAVAGWQSTLDGSTELLCTYLITQKLPNPPDSRNQSFLPYYEPPLAVPPGTIGCGTPTLFRVIGVACGRHGNRPIAPKGFRTSEHLRPDLLSPLPVIAPGAWTSGREDLNLRFLAPKASALATRQRPVDLRNGWSIPSFTRERQEKDLDRIR